MSWLTSIYLFAQQAAGEVAPAAAPQGGAPGAQGGPPPNPCGGQGMMVQLLMIVAIFAIFYFLLIRPQQKRAKEHQAMLGSLGKGDAVYTRGGIYGKIVSLTDNVAVLEVAKVDNKGVHIRVIRDVIAGRQTPTADGGEAKDAASIREK